MEYFNNDIRIIDLIYYLNKYKKGRREKPYKSLERWIQDKGLSETKAIKNLLGASVFYNDSETFVKDLLFGQESDLKRSSSKNYASGAVRIMTLHGSKGCLLYTSRCV